MSYLQLSRPLAVVAGALFVVSPFLVELVAGDFFLLVPLAVLLALAALPGLWRARRRSSAHQAGAWGTTIALMIAIGVEAYEQSQPPPVPRWADVLAPVAFFATGVFLIVAGGAGRRTTHATTAS